MPNKCKMLLNFFPASLTVLECQEKVSALCKWTLNVSKCSHTLLVPAVVQVQYNIM